MKANYYYIGPRCDTCGDNYFGNPETPGGECRPCSCNNNIDIARPGNCDLKTGECIQCLFNTEGFACEHCMAGFYGDALNQRCIGKMKHYLSINSNFTITGNSLVIFNLFMMQSVPVTYSEQMLLPVLVTGLLASVHVCRM